MNSEYKLLKNLPFDFEEESVTLSTPLTDFFSFSLSNKDPAVIEEDAVSGLLPPPFGVAAKKLKTDFEETGSVFLKPEKPAKTLLGAFCWREMTVRFMDD